MTTVDDKAPLRRYIAMRDAGDRHGALAAAREDCAATPDTSTAHCAHGEALTALGDDAGAAQAFAEALRHAPSHADAWVGLGLARYRQGAIAAAKAAMRAALHAAPGHYAATANLGAFLSLTGEAEAGEALLRDTLARRPDAAAARLNLAAALVQSQRGADALALLDAAPALPTALAALREWRLTRILALLQLGRAAEARAALTEVAALGPIPPERAPSLHWSYVLLAQMEGDEARARSAAQEMAAAIAAMGPNATPENRIVAHYAQANFWSERGDTVAAFAHWQAGHALLRTSHPFSRDGFRAFADVSIAAFDGARLKVGPRASNRDPAPVFITGMPRSGTTLCEQILAAHAQGHGAGERPALARLAEALGGSHGQTALDAAALDAAASRYLAELHDLAPDKTRIIDKMPGNELHLGLVALMLPGARIIHCVRDPRDVGLSIWSVRFDGEHAYAHDLADLGWTIAQRARLMAHWRAVLPNPILTVALHDWVRDFDGTLARVLAHLDLPPDPACARFHEMDRDVRTVSRAQVRQPIHAKGLGRWRAYAAQLAPLIAELDAAGLLAAWDDPHAADAADRGDGASFGMAQRQQSPATV